jgi:hypothetical protein
MIPQNNPGPCAKPLSALPASRRWRNPEGGLGAPASAGRPLPTVDYGLRTAEEAGPIPARGGDGFVPGAKAQNEKKRDEAVRYQ